MTTQPTPADTLRRAATMVRELATAAAETNPAPWHVHPAHWRPGDGPHAWLPEDDDHLVWSAAEEYPFTPGGGEHGDYGMPKPVAAHIAAWSPPVALAVADWLEREAEVHDADGYEPRLSALALARALLGEGHLGNDGLTDEERAASLAQFRATKGRKPSPAEYVAAKRALLGEDS